MPPPQDKVASMAAEKEARGEHGQPHPVISEEQLEASSPSQTANELYDLAIQAIQEAEAGLARRQDRLAFLRHAVGLMQQEGAGAIARQLHLRAGSIFGSSVAQFLDVKKRDEALVELSVLRAISDALMGRGEQ